MTERSLLDEVTYRKGRTVAARGATDQACVARTAGPDP
jgi:hypothetical protein